MATAPAAKAAVKRVEVRILTVDLVVAVLGNESFTESDWISDLEEVAVEKDYYS